MACVPSVVVCNFEHALHVGIRDQFESTHIFGCLFHWKLQSKRQAFWDYFVKTWCDTYGISCWNISGMMKENVEIVNRTNNSLKPNNWKLTDTFGAPHPRILNFVEVLKQEAKNYLNQLADVRHRRERPPLHAAPYRYTCVPRLR
ncbi:hypothetical protein F441_00343 [Phytophthora nicotianae CJ01A1]|uniref:MULE transposase domain-containing protein n=1 Tax=Phytophthora nicotianae CJ01A1 TaxID=1317063 RepID=W2XX56_PHYNI|nr:hypothetical protein F441_00343 [Phytophthora nicotianae CJ01A1]